MYENQEQQNMLLSCLPIKRPPKMTVKILFTCQTTGLVLQKVVYSVLSV